jgi:glycosyltransferase involved in cell wall biosynthesis
MNLLNLAEPEQEMIETGIQHKQEAPLELSIVIPLLNEEPNIPRLYERLTEELDKLNKPYEMIMVDDGSTDRTFPMLRELAAKDSRLRIVRLRRRFGQTAGFSAGFARARGKVTITMDGDLQNDPADIGRLLEKMDEGYDVVSGWRKNRQDAYWSRTFPSRIANGLISKVTGVELHDYGCSLKAYRTEVLQNIQLYGELHRFIPAIASWQGVDVAEMPVNHYARQAGTSKYGISRTFRVILDLVTVRFLLSYSTRPMQIFGRVGLLSIVAGILISLYLVGIKILSGWTAPLGDRPLLLLGVLLIIVGIQFISMGLISELVMRVYYETQSRPIYVVREEINAPKS